MSALNTMWGSMTRMIDARPAAAATVCGWAAQLVSVALNLVTIPLITRRFSEGDIGVWFFLINWMTFFQLFDAGVGQSISRHISYCLGGAGGDNHPAVRRGFLRIRGARAVDNLLGSGGRILLWMSIIVLLVGTVAERTWLFGGKMSVGWEPRLAWYFILTGAAIHLLVRAPIQGLAGLLFPAWSHIGRLVVNLVQGGGVILVLLLLPRIWLAGLVYMLAAAVAWVLFPRLFSWKYFQRFGRTYRPTKPRQSLMRVLWRLSWPEGVATACAYFIFTVNPQVIGYLLGKAAVASYQVPLRVATILFEAFVGIASPQLNFYVKLVREGDVKKMVVRFYTILVVTGLAGLLAFAMLGVVGPALLAWWVGGRVAIDSVTLWVICLYYLLALVQIQYAIFILAHGQQPFALVSSAGAILNLGLCVLLVPVCGIVGAALATFGAQLLTSNWYICLRGARLARSHGVSVTRADILAHIREIFRPLEKLTNSTPIRQ